MAVKCANCGGSHPKWDCTKPLKESAAGTQALPVDTDTIVAGDPATGKDFGAKVIGRVLEDGRIEILSINHSKAKFSKSDYQKLYMADLRAIKRLGLSVTVAEWRKTNDHKD